MVSETELEDTAGSPPAKLAPPTSADEGQLPIAATESPPNSLALQLMDGQSAQCAPEVLALSTCMSPQRLLSVIEC